MSEAQREMNLSEWVQTLRSSQPNHLAVHGYDRACEALGMYATNAAASCVPGRARAALDLMRGVSSVPASPAPAEARLGDVEQMSEAEMRHALGDELFEDLAARGKAACDRALLQVARDNVIAEARRWLDGDHFHNIKGAIERLDALLRPGAGETMEETK